MISKKCDNLTSWLQDTFVAVFYRKYLKKNPLIRSLVLHIWRIVLYYVRLVGDKERVESYPLITLATLAGSQNLHTYTIAVDSTIETPVPLTFPASLKHCMVAPHDQYKFPSVYVVVIKDATVYGDTSFVLSKKKFICHDQYNFEKEITFEEYRGDARIDPLRRRVEWFVSDELPSEVPQAASFADASSGNYAHWLTEVLPRICLFCADERFKDIPIIVNDGLHPNIFQSLISVVGTERKIISLPRARAIQAQLLFMTSSAGYAPADRRKKTEPHYNEGRFNAQALKTMRRICISAASTSLSIFSSKKIFIRRTSAHRVLLNQAEIETKLIEKGFVIIEPESLPFLDQVNLMNTADVVISQGGAAVANLIFCRSSAKLIILAQGSTDINYFYWQNIAQIVNVKIIYVLGFGKKTGLHGDFNINIKDLEDALEYKGQNSI